MLALLWFAGSALAATACAAPTRVIDDDGQAIVLGQPARRIVSLAPHVTELLFAAGAGAHLVGASAFSDYPPAAKAIPRISDSFLVDLERIVSLRPDVVIVWRHGNPEGQLEKVRRLGIPVFSSEPRRLADIPSTLRRFGALAGTGAAAERAASAFEARLAGLRGRYAGRPVVSVFYQVSGQPLLTINGDHLIDDVIRACGGRNVFAGLGPLVPMVSAEAVVAADPEAIVTAGGEPGNEADFRTWAGLPAMRATRRHNFVQLDSDTISRQSDRILDGAQALCAALDGVRARR